MTHHDDLDWLRAQQPDVAPADDAATDRARAALLEHVRRPARPLARPRPTAPTRPAAERRWRRPSRVLALAAAAAATFAGLIAVAPSGGGEGGRDPGVLPTLATAEAAPAVRLARQLEEAPAPPGDATLIHRDQAPLSDGSVFGGYDLYTDDGDYFYGATRAQLAAAVAAGQPVSSAAGHVVAAARAAVDLPAVEARQRMIDATYHGGAPEGEREDPATEASDNRIWIGAMSALSAGAGDPAVRAGVLRLLATSATVRVEERSDDGTLVLRSDLGGGYEERLTVDAQTGLPVRFTGGDVGTRPEVRVSYDVRRVRVTELTR